VNKFEALKEFQAWPHDSQLLCVEFFHTAAKDNSAAQVWVTGDQPKTANVAKKTRLRTDYTLEELDFFDSLIHCGVEPAVATERFCKRFPKHGHPVAALRSKFYKRKKKLQDQGDL